MHKLLTKIYNYLKSNGVFFIFFYFFRLIFFQLIKQSYFDLIKVKTPDLQNNFNGSILDPVELSKAIKDCDYVIHLAASLGVANTEKNRLECLHINIQGTINVLEACVKHNVKKVIFASSSEIYGEQKKVPINENAPLNPKSNYAITKLVGEEFMSAEAVTLDSLRHNPTLAQFTAARSEASAMITKLRERIRVQQTESVS